MPNPFVKTSYELTLQTGDDLTDVTLAKIIYTDPNGTQGEWIADVEGDNLVYQLAGGDSGDILINGVWSLQAYVETGTGEVKRGTIFRQTFINTL